MQNRCRGMGWRHHQINLERSETRLGKSETSREQLYTLVIHGEAQLSQQQTFLGETTKYEVVRR